MKKEKEQQLQSARFFIVRNRELESILEQYNLQETCIITGGGSPIQLDKKEVVENQQQELTKLIDQLSSLRETYEDGSAVLAMYWIYQGRVNTSSYMALTPAFFNFFGKKKFITEIDLRAKRLDKQVNIEQFVHKMGFESPHRNLNGVLPLKSKVLNPKSEQ